MTPRVASREGVRLVLDGIFPPSCLSCTTEGEWLCSSCLGTISFVGRVALPDDHPLTTLIAVSSYQQPIIGGLIRSFKYQRALCLEEEALRDVLLRFREESDALSALLPAPTLIVPLPMDPERQRTRGMDHAFRLATLVQALFFPTVPVRQALARTRITQTNARLATAEARAINLEEAFVCTENVKGEEILLIDDVYTSGATLKEASLQLHAAEAASVQGLVLAQSKTS
jgi:ComF family protein